MWNFVFVKTREHFFYVIIKFMYNYLCFKWIKFDYNNWNQYNESLRSFQIWKCNSQNIYQSLTHICCQLFFSCAYRALEQSLFFSLHAMGTDGTTWVHTFSLELHNYLKYGQNSIWLWDSCSLIICENEIKSVLIYRQNGTIHINL